MAVSLSQVQQALADRYAIEREIASGGMASVFLAQDLRHRRSGGGWKVLGVEDGRA